MLIFGVGTSCQSVTIQPYMQLGVEQDRMGTATANLLFGSSIGGTVFSAVYNIFYNIKYAAAAAQGGGEHIAQAIAETFSAAAIFSAICGLLIVLVALLLIPGKKEKGGSAASAQLLHSAFKGHLALPTPSIAIPMGGGRSPRPELKTKKTSFRVLLIGVS